VTNTVKADASPEKRLFISLLTRDIPLVAAFLDLVDNSINAAVEPFANRLRTASEYLALFGDETVNPAVTIEMTVSSTRVEIRDTAGGISAKTAEDHVFKFGRGDEPGSSSDRLSVYGIGLKRAIFKLGNNITIRSDHIDGGFDLNLQVAAWAQSNEQPWKINISPRKPVDPGKTGTTIVVTELYDEVSRRLNDGVFTGQLRDAVSRTYAYYAAKLVTIVVNGQVVDGTKIDLGENHASESFNFGNVTCAVTAGIGVPEGGAFRDRSSGWFVFCNGRAVISADKSTLTGWGGGGLPIFQPKHRPFLGTVFFVSERPEELPWTTTKAGINEDSAIWQTARRHMAAIGRIVISFLDSRYNDEGTEIASADLQSAAGENRVSVLSAAVASPRTFSVPAKIENASVRIQYDAQASDIKRIAAHLKKPGMSGSDVGRHTFNYFLRNEVGTD